MDFVVELLLELLMEGGFALADSKKTPTGIRVLLAVLLAVFYSALIGVAMTVGVNTLAKDITTSIFLFVMAGILIIMAIVFLLKIYKKVMSR